MKKVGIIVVLIFAAGITFFSAFTANREDNRPEEVSDIEQKTEAKSIKISDATGKEVTVQLPIRRVAFNHFSTAEALKIIDAWDTVAGRGRDMDKQVFPNLDDIPVISGQGLYDLDYEKIFELDIDLFITIKISMDGYDEMLSKLEPRIPVITMHMREPGPFRENLEKLGILFGKEKEALAYLQWYEKVISKLTDQSRSLDETDKPRVFFKTGWGSPSDIQTLSDEAPGIRERNELTGVRNVAGDLTSAGGWVQDVDDEWLASQNLDILVVADPVYKGYGIGVKNDALVRGHRKQVMELPAFAGSKAVRNNRVYMITGELFGTPRFVIGFAYMAKWFHPELYQDLEPKALHQEYLTRFLKVDCDLDKQGVFVYAGD